MRVFAGLILLALTGNASAQVDGIEPGLWRVTSHQGDNGPVQTSQRCLSPEQASNLATTFGPQFGGVNTNCEKAEARAETGQVAWRLQCRGQVDIDVGAQFLFKDRKHYSATILTRTSINGAPAMASATTIEGEHAGACP